MSFDSLNIPERKRHLNLIGHFLSINKSIKETLFSFFTQVSPS